MGRFVGHGPTSSPSSTTSQQRSSPSTTTGGQLPHWRIDMVQPQQLDGPVMAPCARAKWSAVSTQP